MAICGLCELRGQFYLAHNGVIADIARFVFGGTTRENAWIISADTYGFKSLIKHN
jgi:hypothetical protein